MRSHWNGHLKLSLVSCPVALYPAISTADRISFRQVNKRTGHRVRQQLVDVVTGEVVGTDDRGKGYEVAEDQFLLLDDEELREAEQEARTKPYSATPAPSPLPEKVSGADTAFTDPPVRLLPSSSPVRTIPRAAEAAEHSQGPVPRVPSPIVNNRTIALDRFVSLTEIDARYLDTPYYIAPRDETGIEAFVVIRDALNAKRMAGMGRVVLARRERPFIVEAMGEGMCGFTLRYSHEIREAGEYFAHIPAVDLPDDMIEMAEVLIQAKAGRFDTAFLEDRYRTVLVSKLKEKQATRRGGTIASKSSRQNVIDLMDALKKSVGSEVPTNDIKTAAKTVQRRRAVAARSEPSAKRKLRPRSP